MGISEPVGFVWIGVFVNHLKIKKITTDFLIIGGGAAGCYAALALCEHSDAEVLIAEKADVRRSGCLAAGINAINAYILPGQSPQDYVDYARRDAEGIVRGDLLLTMAERLNATVMKLESLGLSILKDGQGNYAARGKRNIKINGENIKPLLAKAVFEERQVTIINRVNVFEYIVKDERILGAYAFSIDEPTLYVISAKAAICATGGASGLYKPNNLGFSRHKMWYPPFNTGAGFAMGILAGAEMTTLEMRFVALRCKDTIAPTGTIAQGVGAKQINSHGEIYEGKYGITTSQRLHGTVMENLEGRGPCYLRTIGIGDEREEDLQRAYLNMAPGQTLKWIESGETPNVKNVEIEGTEPYIVGGHAAAGYWVDTNRETTVKGLFAAGDAAGGCPQKYVSGAFAEGEIAAKAALKYIDARMADIPETETARTRDRLRRYLDDAPGSEAEHMNRIDALEEEMQGAMDRYAGGIGQHYQYDEASLATADREIKAILYKTEDLAAGNMKDMLYIFELRERLILARQVIAHLEARKETRWRGFAENTDHPSQDAKFDLYINSKLENGAIRVFSRNLVNEGSVYEH
jgi:adenylylsulfate reductase subunit A